MNVKYLVIHNNGVPGRDIEDIRRTHKAKGWRDIGYHFVINEDGDLKIGRKETQNGAHTRGMNHIALGICLIGNGNIADFNEAQYACLFSILDELMEKYEVPAENVIGHREVRDLIAAGKLDKKYTTRKMCPGTKVDMDIIRSDVS